MLCPGRFLAREAAFTFLATILLRYEASVAAEGKDGLPQKFPRVNDSKPGFGALTPVPGDDVVLKLRMR
jgi:hypothetical protein